MRLSRRDKHMNVVTTLIDIVLKYAPRSTCTVKIAHMEGELSLWIKGDFHRHDCVNFSHPCVNHIIVRSGVESEQPRVNQIQGDVEVLEAPCGNGIWHIERCLPTTQV